jgi:hypothetical protein
MEMEGRSGLFGPRHSLCCQCFQRQGKADFLRGLPDPNKLFNNGLEGKKWRTIDLYEGDKVNESSLKVLVRAGVDFNRAKVETSGEESREVTA